MGSRGQSHGHGYALTLMGSRLSSPPVVNLALPFSPEITCGFSSLDLRHLLWAALAAVPKI